MKKIFLFYLVVFLISFYWSKVKALDIYTFLTTNCQIYSGLIIQAQATKIIILDLKGKTVNLNTNLIEYILIYNSFENPFAQLNIDKNSRPYLKKIYLDLSQKKHITS